ncbi:MAG: hypothetical protein LKG11_04990 [Bacilli bacterium]|jgi:hypothetical protein|nr:hypothetical protein [Bacilli bacterium]
MNERNRYISFFLKNAPSTLFGRIFNKPKQIKRFRGTNGITTDGGGLYLKQRLLFGEPFCAFRFGGSELSCLNGHEKIVLGFKKTYKESVRWAMKVRAGFYPTNDRALNEYCEKFENEVGFADVLAISGLHMEDYFAEKLVPKAHVISNWSMEPLLGGWSFALKGKKVLVVSPFDEEIRSQYARREKLFPNEPDILPGFDLKVVKAPGTMGSDARFADPSFMAALKRVEDEIAKTDFDVALIGAGAYGSLLCFYIRSLGKTAIQTGGSTQTLFGIIGKRWENRPHVASRINEFWIRPKNKPLGCEKIDNGAYW